MRLLALLCVLFSFSVAAQPLPELIPYRVGDKWGYSDSNGKIIIQPQWDAAEFFTGNKARVFTSFGDNNVTCLIDRKGRYVVGPELRWNGIWNGWQDARFNTSDGQGRYGIVDTNGVLHVPHQFSGSWGNVGYQYSSRWKTWYIPAERDGKYGIIDSAGKIIIPFDYTYINTDAIDPYGYLYVMQGENVGIIGTDGKVIIPVGAQEIMSQHERGTIFFYVGYRDSLRRGKHSLYRLSPFTQLFPESDYITIMSDTSFLLRDNNRYTIVNGKGKNLFGRSFTEASYMRTLDSSVADTLFVHTNRHWRKIDPSTLKPYGAWIKKKKGRSGFVWSDTEMPRFRGEPRARVRINGNDSFTFTRDGVRWHVVRYVSPPGIVYLAGDNQTYTAVADSNGNFLLPPVKKYYEIHHYVPAEKLIVYGDLRGWTVADSAFRDILTTPYDVINAFRWKGKTFASVFTYKSALFEGGNGNYTVKSYEVPHNRVVEKDTQFIKALLPYDVHCMSDSAGTCVDKFQGYFVVYDTLTKKKGVVDMDGRIYLRGLSFKYKELRYIAGNMYLVSDTLQSHIVDQNNKELFPGLRVFAVSPAMLNNRSLKAVDIVGGLYTVYYLPAGGRQKIFYMNTRGKAYASDILPAK